MGQLGITGEMRTTPTNVVEAFICLPHWNLWYRARRGPLHNVSGVWDAGLIYNPIEDRVVFSCSFCSQIPYLTWGLMLWGQHLILNPNTVLQCWLRKSGPKDRPSSCSQGACLVYRWIQDGGHQGCSLWAICGKKAQLLSRAICYSLPGQEICYLGACLWYSISE